MKLTRDDIAQLKRLIKAAKEAYYNSGKLLRVHTRQLQPENAALILYGSIRNGKLIMPSGRLKIPDQRIEITDAVYDLIEDTLRLAGYKPTVGAPVSPGKAKVKLPFRMASLDKMKPGDGTVAKFANRVKGPYLVSDKLDGVSIAIVYEAGKAPKAYTRGNGEVGGDISFLVPHLNLPKYNGDLAIRGEVIMSKEKFKQFADEFRNARNLTSGILNKKGIHDAISHVDVVIYEVLSPRGVPSKQLAKLKTLGFRVVPYTVVNRISEDVLSSMLKARRAKSRYELDGLVVMQDAKNPLPTSDNPSYAMAYKEDSEGNLAKAKVVKVWWEASKHRMLKPKVEIEPVMLAGAEVRFATGYNGKFIVDNKIGPGAVVEITRSGEVIPKILRVVKPANRPQMPTDEWVWNKTHVDLLLAGSAKHIGSEVKRISGFLKNGLGVEHVAEGLLARMYEAGLNTVGKLLRATPEDFLRIPGFKDTMANKVYQQIQKGCKGADINAVAANSGIFGLGIGAKRIKVITDKYDLFKLAKLDPDQVFKKVSALPGFSNVTARQIADNIHRFVSWVSKLPITFKKATAVKPSGSKLVGQSVCFTGFRDADLEKQIIAQGGTIVSGVSKNTTILLVKDLGSNSSKMQKAKQLGVKVMTAEQFKKKFL